MNDTLLELVLMDCPICDQVHEVEKRKRLTSLPIKDETVEYEETYYRCNNVDEDEDNEFASAGMYFDNLANARAIHKKMREDKPL